MVSINILIISLVLAATAFASPQQPPKKESPIYFSSNDYNKNRTQTHDRKPLIDSKRCDNDTELLYPGDNEADWVCDCKPGFLFYPLTQKCYASHMQGPCKIDEILTLSANSPVPKCERNRCEKGSVLFQNQCHPLNGEAGCKDYMKIVGRRLQLVVDPTTLQLTCSDNEHQFNCANNCCLGLRYPGRQCDNKTNQN